MQVAGTSCHVCGQRIQAAPDGGACPECKMTFHLACLRDPGLCPECLGDHAGATAAERTATLAEREAVLARARGTIVIVASVVLGLQILASSALWWYGVEELAAAEFARLIWVGVPFVLLYLGVRMARVWLVLSLAFTALVCVAAGINHARSGNAAGAGIALALAAVYAGALCAVAFARSISDHLAMTSVEA